MEIGQVEIVWRGSREGFELAAHFVPEIAHEHRRRPRAGPGREDGAQQIESTRRERGLARGAGHGRPAVADLQDRHRPAVETMPPVAAVQPREA
jgi:hypothetical protein